MQIEVVHPAFVIQRLTVESAGWLTGPKLLVNGLAAKKLKGVFSVASDNGTQIPIKINFNLIDPIPKITIGDESVELAPSLKWYEWVWAGIPVVLIFGGGAIGGFVGALGACASGRVFRSDRSTFAKYGFSALITFGVVIAFVVLVTVFGLLTGTPK